MASIDVSYHGLLLEILERGYTYEDPNRKGINRLEILSHTFRHEFKNGFPAITTKKLNYKNVIIELIWFLRGDTNIKYLLSNSCNIWNKDCLKNIEKRSGQILTEEKLKKRILEDNNDYYGELGPIYGRQWRNFNGVDQIANLIQGLKDKPLGTEHIVMAWNPSDKPQMALPPCHYGFQIVVRPLPETYEFHIIDFAKEKFSEKTKVSESPKYGFELHWSQRSVDTFLGLPYNIASYATLALIIEKLTGYRALAIQGDLKKVHLYDNSLDAVKEQLSRDVLEFDKCELKFDNPSYKSDTKYKDVDMFLDELYPEYFELINYDSYPAINVKMLERNE